MQILFSAHALPQKFIDRGDPYLEHVLDTVRGVMERVGKVAWHLGFQSRSGPVKWMEPETTEVLDRLADRRLSIGAHGAGLLCFRPHRNAARVIKYRAMRAEGHTPFFTAAGR